MPTKKIICLANSKKLNNRCFAGKEINADNVVGNWVRPTDTLNKDSVTVATMSAGGCKVPEILDIVEIPTTYLKVSHHQKENWLFDTAAPWRHVGRFPHKDLPKILDTPEILWPGDSSSKGTNDRLLTTQAYSEVTQSLYLIKAERITLSRNPGFTQKPDYRAEFTYNGTTYNLGNTDLAVQAKLRLDPAHAPIMAAEGILCVSLTEDFNGHCYKLVAGVIL